MTLPLVLGAALVLAAATEPPQPPQPPPARPQTFLSPSGEPFRPTPGGPAPFEAWFARVDANHDGKIDRAEFRADAEAFFRLLDASGDGRIDGFESFAYEHKVAPELIAAAEGGIREPGAQLEGSERRDAQGDRRPLRGELGPAADVSRRGGGHRAFAFLIYEPEPVTGADLDVDSRITAEEWRIATDRRFDTLDPAHVGYLTREALQARMAPPKGKGAKPPR